MSVDDFEAEVQKWLTTAKDGRWKRPYTDLIYKPMLEVMQYLRNNGFKTYIVTGPSSALRPSLLLRSSSTQTGPKPARHSGISTRVGRTLHGASA
jgi:hypothetical protein